MPKQSTWPNVVHLVAVSVWFGALLAAGLSAALIFTQMKAFNIVLPEYANYKGDHGMIAAGKVANHIFLIVDYVQLACALIAFLTLGILLMGANLDPLKRKPPLAAARIAFLTIACGLLSYELFILAPRMAINLKDYWTAAMAGQQQVADAAKAAFDVDHPTASNVLSTTAACVFLLLVTSAIGISRGNRSE